MNIANDGKCWKAGPLLPRSKQAQKPKKFYTADIQKKPRGSFNWRQLKQIRRERKQKKKEEKDQTLAPSKIRFRECWEQDYTLKLLVESCHKNS